MLDIIFGWIAENYFELIAAGLGFIAIFLQIRQNVWYWLVSIIMVSMYIYIYIDAKLYADMSLQVYYLFISIYGWYMWSRIIDDQNHHIPISRTTFADKWKAFGIFLFTSIFVIVVYRYYDVMPNKLNFSESISYAVDKLSSGNLTEFREATPYLDTFTTGIFFAAMWLMANKKIENWTLWIAGNIVSIPLYFVKGYGFTGIQYTIFLILAIQGYFAWRKHLSKNL